MFDYRWLSVNVAVAGYRTFGRSREDIEK